MDVADTINQNIEIKMREIATERMKIEIETQIKELNCKNCNSISYSIKDFSYNPNSVVAHLKCDNCGFEGDFTGNYSLDIEDAQKSVAEGIRGLQKTIEDANRRINK
jgi:RNase P subunit RPR2